MAGGLVASVRPQAFPVTQRRLARQKKIRASRGSISIDPPGCPDACPVHRSEVRFGRPGRALSRPTWSPVKGQFRSRFPPSAQLRLSDNDFSGSPQPTPTSSQRNTSGRAGWKRAGPGCYDAVAIARAAGLPNAGYEPHPSCGDCPLTARSRPQRAAKICRKIVVGQP